MSEEASSTAYTKFGEGMNSSKNTAEGAEGEGVGASAPSYPQMGASAPMQQQPMQQQPMQQQQQQPIHQQQSMQQQQQPMQPQQMQYQQQPMQQQPQPQVQQVQYAQAGVQQQQPTYQGPPGAQYQPPPQQMMAAPMQPQQQMQYQQPMAQQQVQYQQQMPQQQMQYQQTPATNTTTIIVAGGPPAKRPFLGSNPVAYTCPHCNFTGRTNVRREQGTCFWVSVGALCLFCPPFCCLPCCMMNEFGDAVHTCSNCRHHLGTHRKM